MLLKLKIKNNSEKEAQRKEFERQAILAKQILKLMLIEPGTFYHLKNRQRKQFTIKTAYEK